MYENLVHRSLVRTYLIGLSFSERCFFFFFLVCVWNYLPLFSSRKWNHFTVWPENCILLTLNVVCVFFRGSVSSDSLFTNKAFKSFTRCNYQFKLLTVVISFCAMTFHQWNCWRSARASKFYPKRITFQAKWTLLSPFDLVEI